MKQFRTLILLALFLSFSFPNLLSGAIPASERAALIAFYNSTNGDNWSNNSGWKTPPLHGDGFAMPGTEHTWFGISTYNDHVHYMYFYYNNLAGSLPEAFWDLTYLEDVTIQGGDMTGTISPKIENFTRIVKLKLTSNKLSGTIPAGIVNLTTLKDLFLTSNQFTGPIPAGLDKLVNLECLSLVANKLTGTIPPEIGNMTTLRHLDLGINELTGTIPPELGGLKNVLFFRLCINQLTGSIPPELGNMTAVENIDIAQNQLSGAIPSELQNCKQLSGLSIGWNQLTGGVPAWLGTLPKLQYLSFPENNLTGTLPPEIGQLSELQILYGHENQLEGSIPPQYGNLTKMQGLNLSFNQLTGPIPTSLGNLGVMESLNLRYNKFSGSLPKELGNCTGLVYCRISENELTGGIPASFSKLVKLKVLWLNHNHLEGNLPDYFDAWSNLETLLLNCNNFTGPFPPSLCKLTKLKHLGLYSNMLTGEIPGTIVNMPSLTNTYNWTNFRYNGLYTHSPTVKSFLDNLMPGWDGTQAVPPENPAASATSPTSIRVSWDLPQYKTILTGYEVYYSTAQGGPYQYAGQTASETDTFFDVAGLSPGTTYYFIIESRGGHYCKTQKQFSSAPTGETSATTLLIPGTHGLSVLSSPVDGAPVTVSPADYYGNTNGATSFTRLYNEGTTVTLTAPASFDGKVFSKWQKDGLDASTSTALQVAMDANHTVTAIYETPQPTTWQLTVQSQPVSGVSITVSPADNNSQTNGTTTFTRVYNEGTTVTLTAPATLDGKVFSKWQKDGADVSTSTALQVTMDANHTVIAVYEDEPQPPTTHDLTVLSQPASGVSITVTPADNNSLTNGATSFTRNYNEGTTVTLTAPSAANGIPFSKWLLDGAEASTSLVFQVTMDGSHTVTAVYEEEEPPPVGTFRLTVQSHPISGCAVTVSLADNNGASNGTTSFTRIYDEGKAVTLTAPAELEGRAFIKWTLDGVDKTGDSIGVTMNDNHTAIAVYEEEAPEEPATLWVESTHASGTPITVSPEDLNGDTGGTTKFSRSYNKGTSVTLTAPAEHNGHKFDRWTLDGKKITSGVTMTFTISGDHKAKAFYVTPARPGLVVRPVKLNFGVIQGEIPASQIMRVTINNSPADWSAAAAGSWLSLGAASGYGSAEVPVSINIEGLAPGKYKSTITVNAPDAEHSPQTVDVNLTVYKPGNTAEPKGDFATPIDGSTVSGSIAVTGWVVDDIGVDSVKIFREGKHKNDLIYIGDAVFVEGARPDVEALFPEYPESNKAGWGYMLLTHFLPDGGNGTFKLHVVAVDGEGHEVDLGVKTIICDNANAVKPFGAIDTPAQGGEASGDRFVNWGWVLTPQPAAIPTDGSTISVWVDGVNIGNPTYNIFRADIAGLFPGFANTNGAVGYFYLDTSAYEDGLHTIQWLATDDMGHTDGIGSRYFIVNNATSPASRASGMSSVGSNVMTKSRRFSRQPQRSYPDDILRDFPEKGAIAIDTLELEHVRLELAGNEHMIQAGYMVVGEELRPLPIGSTVDRLDNIFYWQPGAGFLGDYRLLFILKEPGKPVIGQWVHVCIRAGQ